MTVKSLFLTTFIVVFSCYHFAQAQNVQQSVNLNWKHTQIAQSEYSPSEKVMYFEEAGYETKNNAHIPIYTNRIKIANGNPTFSLTNIKYENFDDTYAKKYADILSGEFEVSSYVAYENKQPYAVIKVIPVRINPTTKRAERLISFDIQLNVAPLNTARLKKKKTDWETTSVLATGDWYKIRTNQQGVHVINADFIKSMGLNPNDIPLNTFKLYGNGGGMLPELNAADRLDDLTENAIEVRDFNGNNILDGNDQILFFAEASNQWGYNTTTKRYSHINHLYSDFTYYFITYGGAPGKRIQLAPANAGLSSTYTANTMDYLFIHDVNKTNLIASGREWYGEKFSIGTKSINIGLTVPNRIVSEEVMIKTEFVGRSLDNSNFTVRANGSTIVQKTITPVSGSYEDAYVDTPEEQVVSMVIPGGESIDVTYTYNFSYSNTLGWLNYLEVISRRDLAMSGGQMGYRDNRTLDHSVSEFQLNPAGQTTVIWDVTDPTNVQLQQTYDVAGKKAYKANTSELKQYWVYNNADFFAPAYEGRVNNQNLHAHSNIDFVIVSGEEFVSEATRLANFHVQNDGLKTIIVTPQQLYNEFSSGAQDISAIRDFMKMLYDKATTAEEQPKYLLLFGDASYDYKGYLPNNAYTVPTYESRNSYLPVASYCSDDYFGFLDDTEGLWINNFDHALDIGVGRLPVRDIDNARNIVNKILHYKSPASFGDWRSNILVMADDEDGNLHQEHAASFLNEIETNNPQFNLRKLYVDAYPEQSLAIGKRYPDVNEEINNQIDKGVFLFNYSGHGGEQGLGHERFITIPQINNWKNYDKLPIFVTATCEFTRYDDPTKVSPGELIISNPQGGGIGLFTTVRLVYANPNKALNLAMFKNNLFELRNGELPTFGDVIMDTKNNAPKSDNNRNFSFIGDPALQINLPRYKVETTAINGIPAGGNDTMKALQKVTITGKVTDDNGVTLTNFNGVVYPTVYDKKVRVKTLVNNPPTGSSFDGSYPDSFEVYKSVLYKGKSEVVNGIFTFTFIVPKDISFKYGNGRISYYAENGITDAIGYYDQFIVGGSSSNAPEDKVGPEISLFMNDESFVFGGTTNEDPILLVKLKDENGINTVGNGIGRDLVATIDKGVGESEDEYVLNDFYEAKLNSYQEGEIRYQLNDLSNGMHTLTFKAWDVYNNSSEAYTEFVVTDNAKLALEHVLNYPNPFTTNTTFHFDHNKAGQDLQVQVQVMTVSGKIVKTINTSVTSADTHIGNITWDGRDDYGDQIGKGVYVYRLTVKSADGQKTEEIEKLVILK